MTEQLLFCVPCLFGLEAPLAEELRALGMKEVRSDNGRVRFRGDAAAMASANLHLRCGERVLIELGSFPAPTFDALFEGTKNLPWEDFIPKDGNFPVKGHSLDSDLHSVPDCQRIVKKAVAVRLGETYRTTWLSESGDSYQIQFSIMKDTATLYLDTSGLGLHKRGYRPVGGDAPLRETLAAGLVSLARYRGQMDFADPFCGSGTLVIEAALTAKNRAPGLGRHFAAERWPLVSPAVWTEAREKAEAAELTVDGEIYGSDLDPRALELAQQNAVHAGVQDIVRLTRLDAGRFQRNTERGVLVTNPPYGERLMDKRQVENLYHAFGEAYRNVSGWSAYILSGYEEFERAFGHLADKKRKLYNGMIKCDLYMYLK